MKRVWYPGNKPTYQMSFGISLSPGWNNIRSDEIADTLLASGLVKADECATCADLPVARDPGAHADPEPIQAWNHIGDGLEVSDQAEVALQDRPEQESEMPKPKRGRRRKKFGWAGGGASTEDGGD